MIEGEEFGAIAVEEGDRDAQLVAVADEREAELFAAGGDCCGY